MIYIADPQGYAHPSLDNTALEVLENPMKVDHNAYFRHRMELQWLLMMSFTTDTRREAPVNECNISAYEVVRISQ